MEARQREADPFGGGGKRTPLVVNDQGMLLSATTVCLRARGRTCDGSSDQAVPGEKDPQDLQPVSPLSSQAASTSNPTVINLI